jgi:hypothetical protein
MIAQLVIFLVICLSISPVVYLWVKGLDYMNKNHPDYKADDFLNWGKGDENEDDKNEIM